MSELGEVPVAHDFLLAGTRLVLHLHSLVKHFKCMFTKEVNNSTEYRINLRLNRFEFDLN